MITNGQKWHYLAVKSLSTIRHINSETNPPSPIINVVFKYLRQFLGTSFSVATRLLCGNIWQGEGPELFLQGGSFHDF